MKINEKMLNIINHQKNSNQKHNKISPHTCLNSYYQKDKTDQNKRRRGCGEKGTLVHCWWECKLVKPLWKIFWRVLKKHTILSSSYTSGCLSKENKTLLKRYKHPHVHFSIITIAKIWKQSKYTTMNEQIKKLWYSSGWVAQLGGVSCITKCCGFNSQLGYMPRLWVWQPISVHMGGN